jgi:site-specific recombinase XerD
MNAHRVSAPKALLGPVLQRYFGGYLIGQRELSSQTVSAYRDTFKLLLQFLEHQGIPPDAVCVQDLEASRVLAFLDDLERRRGNTARTRNARLAAIRSFLRYAVSADPLLLSAAQGVLAIPVKRFERKCIGHLTRQQMQAILEAPDPSTHSGERDRVLLMLLYNTGARVSEVVSLRMEDVLLVPQASVHIRGKGRKHRSVPLWRQTVKLLRPWLRRLGGSPQSPLLPNARGGPMTRSGVAQRLDLAVRCAAIKHSALRSLRVSPHTIRHTTAMHLLQSGVDLSVIALWLGHDNPQTTHQYLDADLETKKRALARLQAPNVKSTRRRSAQPIMQFLKDL